MEIKKNCNSFKLFKSKKAALNLACALHQSKVNFVKNKKRKKKETRERNNKSHACVYVYMLFSCDFVSDEWTSTYVNWLNQTNQIKGFFLSGSNESIYLKG